MTTPTPRFEPRQLRDWAGNRECCEGVSAETVAYERLAHAAVLEELAAAREELAALKAELVSVKAGYMKLAKHAERISVYAENLEYEGGYVVSGVSELNEAVDAYRADKETP